jgi:hypothetical protein
VIGDSALQIISANSDSATSRPMIAAKAAEDVIGEMAQCRIRMVYSAGITSRMPEKA